MIRMKEVMDRLEKAEDENGKTARMVERNLNAIHEQLEETNFRLAQTGQLIGKMLDGVYRLEACVAMAMRKYEQTLIKEEDTHGT